MEWYQKSIDLVVQELKTSQTNGLALQEIPERLEKYGPNKLKEAEKTPLIEKFINQLKDPLVLILIAAAIISALTDSGVEALIIIAIVIDRKSVV